MTIRIARPSDAPRVAELLGHAEAWARAQGVRLVRLRCNVARVRAHGFYLRAGYSLAKTSHLFTKTLAADPVLGPVSVMRERLSS